MEATYILPSVRMPIDRPASAVLQAAAGRMRSMGIGGILTYRVYRRSVDARKRDAIDFVYSVAVRGDFSVKEEERLVRAGLLLLRAEEPEVHPGHESMVGRPIVVGSGPAGMFCALLLAESGYRPLLLERGGDITERKAAVARFRADGLLDTDSNIQFGAGGAGTFSDGKLVTRVNDGMTGYVLRRFVEFGAPEEITLLSKPHIGTDRLCTVVEGVLARLIACGGEVRYHAHVTDIVPDGDGIAGVLLRDGTAIACGPLVLATGHSARDTYSMLMKRGVHLEPKAFSVGLRAEHLQEDIDRALYGRYAGHPALGHAEYALSDRSGARGVYTFCMCPGGEVVAAASESGGVVVNGMSRYARDGRNANAAVAVSVLCEDYGNRPERAIAFQREIERVAYQATGSDYRAPACLLGDFLEGRCVREPKRIEPSYRDGNVCLCLPDDYLPPFVCRALRQSLPGFGRRIEGYDAWDAVLTGPETRTSAPVRIVRGEARTAPGFSNLYPCGEGAGYAGGITSAALDGLRTAMAVIGRYRAPAD